MTYGLKELEKNVVVIQKAQVPLLATLEPFQTLVGEGFTPSRGRWPAVAGGDEPRPYEISSHWLSIGSGARQHPYWSFLENHVNIISG